MGKQQQEGDKVMFEYPVVNEPVYDVSEYQPGETGLIHHMRFKSSATAKSYLPESGFVKDKQEK